MPTRPIPKWLWSHNERCPNCRDGPLRQDPKDPELVVCTTCGATIEARSGVIL